MDSVYRKLCPLSDVSGVVADSLIVFGDHQKIKNLVTGKVHGVLVQRISYFIEKIIQNIITADHLFCQVTFSLYISGNTVIYHMHGIICHFLKRDGCYWYMNAACVQNLRNISSLVADSLHICYHLKCCGNFTKISTNRLLFQKKLHAQDLYTMGDIARCSIGQPTDYHNEELLYKLFGVNAELLIDHAWGWEPCTIADIKAYKPENKSIVSGQILQYPYPFEKARLVIQEMADALALELVDKRLATNQLVLTVGYDIENLKGTVYTGEVTTDRYGRKIPKHAHGTVNLDGYTSSGEELLKAATSLYDRIVDKTLLARRLTLCANHLLDESSVPEDLPEQIDLFTDYSAKEKQKKEADTAHARERKLQETMLDIKKRFGKNAILKGLNLEDGATARERNNQIGGHKA